jgi:E3 ubiquitin-protein ligase RNF5
MSDTPEKDAATPEKGPAADPTGPGNDKWTCPICFDRLTEPVVTSCGHIFCWPCISEWLRRSSACPTCSGHVDADHLISVHGRGRAADLRRPPPLVIELPRPPLRDVPAHLLTPVDIPRITPETVLQVLGVILFFLAWYL